MRLSAFAVGPSNVSRSISQDGEELINWYQERPDAGTPKSPLGGFPTPGLEVFADLDAAPVRGLWAQDGRCFAVAGTTFYEIHANQTETERGTVAMDANPATIHSNGSAGKQLFIVSGGKGYIYDLTDNTLTEITDDGFPTPALMGEYVDSYFLVLQAQSQTFAFSSLLDGLEWDTLDWNTVSQSSDLLRSMIVNQREVWLFGSRTTAIWHNTGDATTPFQPIPQAYLQVGIAGSFCVARFDNSMLWLSENEHGARMVFRANGYSPQRVSTHSIETYLDRLPRVDDAIAWTYQQDGHTFWCLYLPAARHTLVYDVATGLWHKRAVWDSTTCRWYPDLGRCHAYVFGKHLVGDRQSGTVYHMDLPQWDTSDGSWRFADYEVVVSGGL